MRQTMTITGGSKGQEGAGFWRRPLSSMEGRKGNLISLVATVKLMLATCTVARIYQTTRVSLG